MIAVKQRLIRWLGFAGLIPFLVAAIAVQSGISWRGIDPLAWFIAYGAVILGFLGGTLWGRALSLEVSRVTLSLLVLSNLSALMAWLGLLLTQPDLSLLVLMSGFVLVMWIERHFLAAVADDSNGNYIAMRYWLTGSVVGLHLLLLWQYR